MEVDNQNSQCMLVDLTLLQGRVSPLQRDCLVEEHMAVDLMMVDIQALDEWKEGNYWEQ